MKVNTAVLSLSLVFALVSSVLAEPVVVSTSDDRAEVEVTVYNDNLGLIKEVRKVELPKGQGELRFMDVAAHIRPVTVHVKSTHNPADFSVLEQNYEYDLISPEKLLDKYVGKNIKLIEWNKIHDRKEIVEATLLSNNQGQVYKINDEIYLGHHGIRVLPRLPEDLIAKPTLMWLYNSGTDKQQTLEVSYLTGNLSWRADYVVVLNKDDTSADVSGWVTLENESGATYKDARLKLVAGRVHQVEPPVPRPARGMEKRALAAPQAPQFQEQAFFEYHMYDLQRRTTIKNNQAKQVSLLEASDAKVAKELLVYGIQSYFTGEFRDRNPKQPVGVYIKFKNSKENNLGMPLPEGIMRLYKTDRAGSNQFIGEDKIQHTPKDEEVKLKIGEAFDVVAERKQIDFKRITANLFESEWEIALRNHKEQEVEVGVIEPLFGSWQVISNSHPFTKIDARTIRFNVLVPKDGEVKARYRVRVGF